jgi:hypothetical protein
LQAILGNYSSSNYFIIAAAARYSAYHSTFEELGHRLSWQQVDNPLQHLLDLNVDVLAIVMT